MRQVLGFLWLLVLIASCSTEREGNPWFGKPCEPGQETYMGFCLGSPLIGSPDLDGGTPCEIGDTLVCYEADAVTVGHGECGAGTKTCIAKNTWGPCEGQRLPEKESCNGKDDDCDDVLDEVAAGAECSAESRQGACAEGFSVCISGVTQCWTMETVRPRKERCDGNDLDCDGIPSAEDPDSWTPCYDSSKVGCTPTGDGGYLCTGECRHGYNVCTGEEFGACEGAIYPRDEEPTRMSDAGVFEIFDEDCDGKFDEGFPCAASEYNCYSGSASTRDQGACHSGKRSCSDAGLGPCLDEQLPEAESCLNHDGTDNDCNGTPDDIPGIGASCAKDSDSYCELNAERGCDPNITSAELSCVNAEGEVTGERCDGIDNDCNGQVDESCNNGTRSCCPGAGCVDTMSNNDHCGGCGQPCGEGTLCCEGVCTQADTLLNCRGCGLRCGLLESCTATGCRVLGLL